MKKVSDWDKGGLGDFTLKYSKRVCVYCHEHIIDLGVVYGVKVGVCIEPACPNYSLLTVGEKENPGH
jgi:hypothetical protein